MLPTRLSRVAVAALALAATACGDLTKPTPTLYSTLNSYDLYAMNGAPARGPTALAFIGNGLTRGMTRADGNFTFDLAFDLDSTGAVVLYPARTLASSLGGLPKRVGLQSVTGGFDDVQSVPATGYDTLSVRKVAPGAVVAVEVQEAQYCLSSTKGFSVYGKLVVDSVVPAGRQIFGRYVLDPNCGYRQVKADTIPEF
jgi:hypothetical protein